MDEPLYFALRRAKIPPGISGGTSMKRFFLVLFCALALVLSGSAQTKKSAMKKSAAGPTLSPRRDSKDFTRLLIQSLYILVDSDIIAIDFVKHLPDTTVGGLRDVLHMD